MHASRLTQTGCKPPRFLRGCLSPSPYYRITSVVHRFWLASSGLSSCVFLGSTVHPLLQEWRSLCNKAPFVGSQSWAICCKHCCSASLKPVSLVVSLATQYWDTEPTKELLVFILHHVDLALRKSSVRRTSVIHQASALAADMLARLSALWLVESAWSTLY